MKTIIHFIRHGKTNNPHKIVKGKLPLKLSLQGIREVNKLAKYLSQEFSTDYIFFSPILRTKQTAQIIKKHFPQSKLKADKNLYEWITPWQGLTIKQIQKDSQMGWDLYNNQPLKFHPLKKGEKAITIVKRLNKFVKQVLQNYNGQQIIAVSHGDPIKLLRCYLNTGKISSKFHTYPCTQPSVTSFIFKDNKYKKTKYKSFIKRQNRLAQ